MLCAATGGGFEENIETTGFDYFAEDELPELAGEKNNEEQIRMCFDAYRAGDKWKTFFDRITACRIHVTFSDELDTQIFYKKIEIGSFIGLNKEYNRKHKNK